MTRIPEPMAGQTAQHQQGEVFARLYGEPLFEIPQELYIPPEALEVFLDSFEGPLDLLLYLIRKQNFNVLDIPMALLTEQYLNYVSGLEQSHFELAGDYLLMAAMLIEIKSRMLLPVEKAVLDDEGDDPRAELVERLLLYEQIKKGAQKLKQYEWLERDFWRPWMQVDIEIKPMLPKVQVTDLVQAWQNILKRAQLHKDHAIVAEPLSVRAHMSLILRQLKPKAFTPFSDLFKPYLTQHDAPAIVVVHFLAVLELVREALIELTQTKPYAPIYVSLAYSD